MVTCEYKEIGNVKYKHKVALIADLHNAKYTEVLKNLQLNSPDVIIIAGDIVNGIQLDRNGFTYDPKTPMLLQFPNADRFIHEVSQITTSFFSYGNHEWLLNGKDIERIESAGVIIVHNSYVRYKDIVIGGLSSPDVTNYWIFQDEWRKEHPTDSRGNLRRPYYCWKTHEDRKTVDASWLSDFEAQDGFKLLVCHHPEYWALKEPYLKDHPIDLVLAGHAHGGQIRIGKQGLYASGQGWLPKYTGGIHHGKYGDMVISRGLSNTQRIPRLFNPTEIIYISIIPRLA